MATTTDYINKLNELRQTAAANLTDKKVNTDSSATWNTIVDNIANIKEITEGAWHDLSNISTTTVYDSNIKAGCAFIWDLTLTFTYNYVWVEDICEPDGGYYDYSTKTIKYERWFNKDTTGMTITEGNYSASFAIRTYDGYATLTFTNSNDANLSGYITRFAVYT